MFQTEIVEEIKTHILYSVNFFFENLALYEIMWKNNAESGRPQMTIWHMSIACRTPKTTNIHPKYVIFISFPMQQWLQEHLSIICYTYMACLVTGLFELRRLSVILYNVFTLVVLSFCPPFWGKEL